MGLVTLPIVFDWDEGNLSKNLRKHNVSLQEAEQVFFNRPLLLSADILHSNSEERYKALGKSDTNRKLVAVFTLRSGKLRIISIRDMSQKERSEYEKVKENPII